MQNKNILVGCKLIFALLGLSAVVTEIAVLAERGIFVPANFFSYFTIESNILVVVVLLLSALAAARRKQTTKLAMLRGATTLYIVITGVVFGLLLSGIENAAFTAVAWDNLVLHYIMPVAVLVDWLIDPPKHKLQFKQALVWLTVPVVYVSYSLTRGVLVDWYPYPFLNPTDNGYGYVAMMVSSLLALGVVLTWLLVKFQIYAANKKALH